MDIDEIKEIVRGERALRDDDYFDVFVFLLSGREVPGPDDQTVYGYGHPDPEGDTAGMTPILHSLPWP